MSTSRFFRNKTVFIFFCLILILALPLVWVWQSSRAAKQDDRQPDRQQAAVESKSPQSGYRSSTGKHKLRVTDSKIAGELKRLGARLVADYGSFQVFNADEMVVRAMRKSDALSFSDEDNLILLNSGALDTTKDELRQQRGKIANPDSGEASLHLIQFAGPIKPDWYAALEATGVKIVNYIPNNAYLVYGDQRQLNKLSDWASRAEYVQWDGEYKREHKIDPAVFAGLRGGSLRAAEDTELFAIQLVADEEGNQTTKLTIDGLKTEPIRSQFSVLNYVNIIVKLPILATDRQLAARPDVVSISRYVVPEKFDERQNVIMTGNLTGNSPTPSNYLTYLANQGFTQGQFDGSGFGVNVVDSGIDNATTSPNHFALYSGGLTSNASRVSFNRLEGTPNGANSTLLGCDGHGNINAHIIGGFIPTGSPFDVFPHADANGFRYGLGVAPFVRLGSTVVFDPSTWTFPSLPSIESRAYNDNSRISSNSWGSNVGGDYTIDSQAYDALVRDAQPVGAPFTQAGNQEMVIVFSAGNHAVSMSIGAPGTAKNVITVGAAENVQAIGGSDGCGIADTGADNANDVISFSSRGPTTDGRHKPEIVAPGTHITGGVAQATNPPATGQSNACYTGSGVCGGVSGANFFPTGQQFYTASSGTSHSAPAVAGAAALLRQRFLNASLSAPSPAMTKAVLMNSARYMTGTTVNDTLWSDVQGMGEVNLTTAFGLFTAPSVLQDQLGADTFTATGQTRIFTGTISNSGQPFRVTTAWTDAPGPTSGDAFVNNLDLEVTVGGQTYKGNVFSGASSTTGGSADTRDNAESVFIPAGVSGPFTVKIIAANIAGDGVPNSGGVLDQDFALVINNGALTPQAVIAPAGSAITTENCGAGNISVDPGETVTVNLSLQNVGTANTTNLVATLQATGGVNSPSGAQTYGALTFGGAAVTKAFTFTASGTCGGTVTATLALLDGVTNLGTVTFTFTLGSATVTSSTFSNAAAITIPGGAPTTTVGNASPYPSQISVTGMTGSVSKVTVTLTGVNHTFPDDIDMLLVGPGGQKVILMSDAGAGFDIVSANITFDDTGVAIPNSTAIATGTYGPANHDSGITDVFSAPAPAGPYSAFLSAFNGTAPNGTWSLYIVDDGDGEVGSMTGGWSLNVTTSTPSCCSVACSTFIVNPPTLPNGFVGSAYSQQLTQTSGALPATFNLTGALPPGLMFTAAGLLSGTPTTVGSYNFSVSATDANNCVSSLRQYTVNISGDGLMYYPLSKPIRLFDTRAPIPGFAACEYLSQPLVANGELLKQARISCDGVTIPANAQVIVGNATVVNASADGFITIWPDGQSRPPVSNLNYVAGQTVPNSFTSKLSATGNFRVYSIAATDFIVDVTGYFAPPAANGLYYHSLPKPIRLFDTRAPIPGFFACQYLSQALLDDSELVRQARGTCDGVTIPNDAIAIVGNATVTGATGDGFITLWPNGQTRPPISNLNYLAGATIPNSFTVGLDSNGQFRIYSQAATDFIVDVSGYYSPSVTDINGAGLLYSPLMKPIRLFDTRAQIPGFPACEYLNQPLVGGNELVKQARITCDGVTISASASSIVGNATVVQASANGFITLWPDGPARPVVSNLNYVTGQTVPNAFTVGLSAAGNLRIYSLAGTHFIVDVAGYFAP